MLIDPSLGYVKTIKSPVVTGAWCGRLPSEYCLGYPVLRKAVVNPYIPVGWRC